MESRLAVVLAFTLCPAASAAEKGRALLNAALPPADNWTVVGDPLLHRLPGVRTVVRVKDGKAVPLEEPGGLDVAPGLLADDPVKPESPAQPVKAKAQLDAVARKDVSVDGSKPTRRPSRKRRGGRTEPSDDIH